MKAKSKKLRGVCSKKRKLAASPLGPLVVQSRHVGAARTERRYRPVAWGSRATDWDRSRATLPLRVGANGADHRTVEAVGPGIRRCLVEDTTVNGTRSDRELLRTGGSMAPLGKPKRRIHIEPKRDPVRRDDPAPLPKREAPRRREGKPVPA